MTDIPYGDCFTVDVRWVVELWLCCACGWELACALQIE